MIGGISSGAAEGGGAEKYALPSSLEQLAELERLRGKPDDLDLGALLREVVCEVPRLLVEITAFDAEVHAHDEDLRTVLRNVLMNVRDHAGGHAMVSCRTDD
jgi:hypothetical protein